MLKEDRNIYIDIVKGIGIISVVVGHCVPWKLGDITVHQFVYLYHLMVFFFIAGFCFNDKYESNIELYFGKKLMSLLPLFVLYNAFFIIMHNMFSSYGFIIDKARYSLLEIFKNILLSFTFYQTEWQLPGALWFVPTLFFAELMFGLIFSATRNFSHKMLIRIILYVILGLIGLSICQYLYIQNQNATLQIKINISLLAVPIIFIGFICKTYKDVFNKLIYPIGAIPSGLFLYFLISCGGGVELSQSYIHPLYLFYPVTLVGIYFCFALAKLLNNKYTCKLFSIIGKNSFHIMGLHFLVFKIVDVFYAKVNNITDYNIVSVYPCAFNCTVVYLILGISLPIIFMYILRILLSFINRLVLYIQKNVNAY